jgi:hypothetical protein
MIVEYMLLDNLRFSGQRSRRFELLELGFVVGTEKEPLIVFIRLDIGRSRLGFRWRLG